MDKLNVHDLVFNYDRLMIRRIPEGFYLVQFDDQEVKMSNRQILVSWYYWEMYRLFPGPPVLSTTAITGLYHSGTHREVGSVLIWHVFNWHQGSVSLWDLSQLFLEIGNELYNVQCIELSEYVTSASLYDIHEIINEPSIKKAKEDFLRISAEGNYSESVVSPAIKEVYDKISDVLYKDLNYLRHNGVKKLCMAGLVNKGQMLQLVGIRGYVHDINNRVFPYAIDTSYAEGFDTLYDSMIESRSASRATLAVKDPLQKSEYFNRKIQLAAMVVKDHVHIPGGCTGYVTVPYLVEEHDLTLLKGKYHMVNDQPELIWDSILHLVGKTIQLRSVTGCGCEDVQTVCNICLGWSHNIIPPKTNLGFYASTPLCALISQTILGTKHHEGSAPSKDVHLDQIAKNWLTKNSKNPDLIYINTSMMKNPIKIRIDSEYTTRLSQILHTDVSELPPERITCIPDFGIAMADKEGRVNGAFDIVRMEVSGMGIHLSAETLKYLKTFGWDSGKGYIEITIDPKQWNTKWPVFNIPKIGDNIMTFFNDIKSFLEGGEKTQCRVTRFNTRGAAISELISILRRRLNKDTRQEFNIVQVEIFIRAMMMVNLNNRQYELPHPSQEFHFVSLPQAIANRTMTSMLAFEGQAANILSTKWLNPNQKTQHPMDAILDS